MTKTQLRKKFKELKKGTNKSMDELLEKALKAGAFEIRNYEDDFILPKIIMTAICKELAQQWQPLSPEGRKKAINLGHFL